MTTTLLSPDVPLTSTRRLGRLLIVTPRYLPEQGGVEVHVHEVARRIAALGVEVTIATTDRSGTLPRDERDGDVRVVRVPAWPKRLDLHIAPRLAGIIEAGRWDLMHLQSCFTAVAPIAMRSARRAGLPYVVSFHGTGSHPSRARVALRPLQHRALAPLLRDAARLIGLTHDEIEYYREALDAPLARFAQVQNGADLPHPGVDLDARPTGPPIVASIGRLVRSKGHHRVLAAMPAVIAARPGTRLWIAGAGPEEGALRDLAASLGIAASVEISSIPAGERGVMARRLAATSVAVLLSDGEGQPLAVLEAASLGRPVVVADSPGLRELARDGIAVSVAKTDTRATAAAIVAAIDRGPRAPHGALPTWDACTQLLLDVYETVLGAAGGGGDA